ncbi:MAG TPA: hypothetical protein VIK86_05500 [Candidatus Paceibacterota bacterium]
MTERDLHPIIKSNEKVIHFLKCNKDDKIHIKTLCGRTSDSDINGKLYSEQQIKISETDRYTNNKEIVNCTPCRRLLKLKI